VKVGDFLDPKYSKKNDVKQSQSTVKTNGQKNHSSESSVETIKLKKDTKDFSDKLLNKKQQKQLQKQQSESTNNITIKPQTTSSQNSKVRKKHKGQEQVGDAMPQLSTPVGQTGSKKTTKKENSSSTDLKQNQKQSRGQSKVLSKNQKTVSSKMEPLKKVEVEEEEDEEKEEKEDEEDEEDDEVSEEDEVASSGSDRSSGISKTRENLHPSASKDKEKEKDKDNNNNKTVVSVLKPTTNSSKNLMGEFLRVRNYNHHSNNQEKNRMEISGK